MRGQSFGHVVLFSILVVLLGVARVALGEGLGMDMGAYPKLVEQLASPDGPIFYEEDKSPVYVLTRLVVEGNSAEDWTEALETVATSRDHSEKNVKAWYEAFREQGDATCPSEWQVLAQEKKTMTLERRSPACGDFVAQHALYRVIYGRRDVFTLIATRKGEMDAATRDSWLAVLSSAEVR